MTVVAIVVMIVVVVIADNETSLVIENHAAEMRAVVEVEHVHDRAGNLIEGTALVDRRWRRVDRAQIPIRLNEPEAGSLIGRVVRDEVLLGPGRDHEERQADAVAATRDRDTARARRIWRTANTGGRNQ